MLDLTLGLGTWEIFNHPGNNNTCMFNTSTISCFTGRSGSLCISIRMHWCLTSQHKLILRVVIGKTLWPGSQNGSISNYLLCAHHKALLCDWTIYTLLRSSVTHARICLPHARNHKRSIRRNVENGPASRIKMADCCALVSMGRYSYLRNEAIIRKTPNLNTILRPPVCLVCRLVA